MNKMKQLTYEELWQLAFIDSKSQFFNENYFNKYIKRNKEYQECYILRGSFTQINSLNLGLKFKINDKYILIAHDLSTLDLDVENIVFKYRVDPWKRVLDNV